LHPIPAAAAAAAAATTTTTITIQFTSMGNLFASLFSRLKKRETRVLLLGLDHAGKTTVLSQLGIQNMYSKNQKLKDSQEGIDDIDVNNVVPTVGFNVKEVVFDKLQFLLWDLGGQTNIRQMWKYYYKGTDGLIYVIDSSDHERLKENKIELENLLSQEELKGCCLLIIANKMDKRKYAYISFSLSAHRNGAIILCNCVCSCHNGFFFKMNVIKYLANAMSTRELIAKLGLEETVGNSRPWFVHSTCALSGEGLINALEWLVEKLQHQQQHSGR
jgi:small GTP-binding protein